MIYPVVVCNISDCNIASIVSMLHPIPEFRELSTIRLLSLTVRHRHIAIVRKRYYNTSVIMHVLKIHIDILTILYTFCNSRANLEFLSHVIALQVLGSLTGAVVVPGVILQPSLQHYVANEGGCRRLN